MDDHLRSEDGYGGGAGLGTLLAAGLITMTWSAFGSAQSSDAAQANNPLAKTKAFNIQGYYIGELTESDANAGQMLLRYAAPVSLGNSTWLVRATLPFNDFPVADNASTRSGPGDIDVFAAYLFDTGNPAISFGIGPQVVLPTAAPNELGSDQWQIGVANVFFDARSARFQYGYLAIYRAGIGDTNDRERVSLLAGQPFAFLQLGDGWYTGSAPLWTYDFRSDDYSVPVGVRIGKVFSTGGTVFNVFMEPQWSVAEEGAGLPEWQLFFAMNMQF